MMRLRSIDELWTLVDALVDSLPKCNVKDCGRVATRAFNEHSFDAFRRCDFHATEVVRYPGEAHTVTETQLAIPLRNLAAARAESG